ncbi:NADP-dependent oxidoreductase, putative [Babesia ovis]|uniref:NADP-dependent oxidoreductase, putative n=1 Tax=Babesia ovis TaxID=5869 RepID=A0A9W5TCS7_BABOV|nr:NADP-dependent oxidoreductase, putative [Babesia ovis]
MSEPQRFQSFHIGDDSSANRCSVYVRTSNGDKDTTVNSPSYYPEEPVSGSDDRVLLRNILLCFHFLDPQARGYVNIEEAKSYINETLQTNPQLLKLLDQVLLLLGNGNVDGKIEKDLFVQQLETYLRKQALADTIALHQLRKTKNPISIYFDTLCTLGSVANGGVNGLPEPITEQTADRDGIYDDNHILNISMDSECTFKPVINRRRHECVNNIDLKQEIKEMQQFKCETHPGTGMNEYIVFHFNRENEWSGDLRGLTDPRT